MYEKKDILKKAEEARKNGDLVLSGMLEDYSRLQFSYIPQILKKIESTNPGGYKFPHTSKPCQHQNSQDSQTTS